MFALRFKQLLRIELEIKRIIYNDLFIGTDINSFNLVKVHMAKKSIVNNSTTK